MSDSVRPHRRKPTRLRRPWDSPGKNTGVGCHFLLQCMNVKSESEVAQLCPTPSDPMDCSLPGSSVPGIFQARGLEWGATAEEHIKIQRESLSNILRSCLKQHIPKIYLNISDMPHRLWFEISAYKYEFISASDKAGLEQWLRLYN